MRILLTAMCIVLGALIMPTICVAGPRYDVLIVKDTRQKGQVPVAQGARRTLEKLRADIGLSSQELPVDEYDVHVAGQRVAVQRLKLDQKHLPVVAVCSLVNGQPARILKCWVEDNGQLDTACLTAMGYVSHTMGLRLSYLGVGAQNSTAALRSDYHIPLTVQGVIILLVDDKGPAAAAGVRKGDVVESLGGTAVRSHEALTTLVHLHKPGETVELKVWRAGQDLSLSATLTEVPNF